MNVELLLDVVLEAGKMLIESGAEIYRVEETINQICKGFDEVVLAESYVTTTGIMISIKTGEKTYTRIGRVYTRSVNLEIVHRMNALSRKVEKEHLTVDELVREVYIIKNSKRYSPWLITLFGGIGAAAFALFFDGNAYEIGVSFVMGLFVRITATFLSNHKVNPFINNVLSSALAVLLSHFIARFMPCVSAEIVTISSIMLLVPGLAITNAIRDTMSGDYVSGMARGTEAFIISAAIAIGAALALAGVRLW
ncbi:MAG: threonine/serine exporter family protein [Holdemanella sp.]|nr:threonine/serine exporter family protein [Holdemanella sp.]